MRNTEPLGLVKVVLWEEAKGKLRAMVAAQMQEIGAKSDLDGMFNFQKLEQIVDGFIAAVEEEELHL